MKMHEWDHAHLDCIGDSALGRNLVNFSLLAAGVMDMIKFEAVCGEDLKQAQRELRRSQVLLLFPPQANSSGMRYGFLGDE